MCVLAVSFELCAQLTVQVICIKVKRKAVRKLLHIAKEVLVWGRKFAVKWKDLPATPTHGIAKPGEITKPRKTKAGRTKGKINHHGQP
jgi:hypothetical protein